MIHNLSLAAHNECRVQYFEGQQILWRWKGTLKPPFSADSSGELMTALHYQMSKAVSTSAGNAAQLEWVK